MSTTEMDGFEGSVLAAESVLDATTILHGPYACRMFMSLISERYVKREYTTREGDYFFHFSRIPCTSVDRDDYIYGASKKVAMILDILEQDETRFATIVQSPGTSLIGDKLKDEVIGKGLDDKTLVMDMSFMSEKFSLGFDVTLTKMAEKIVKPAEKRKGAVNIIGLPFTSRGYYSLVKEMKRVLSMVGIEVIAAVGAGCSLEEFRNSSAAECNVCIHPEYCRTLSGFYSDVYGIPTVFNSLGAPIGYRSMRSFIETVCAKMGKDPSPALKELEEDDHFVRNTMSSAFGAADFLNYKTFAVKGESSVVYPLIDFLARYLKMVPSSVCITEPDPAFDPMIREALEKLGCSKALEEPFGEGYVNVMFGPGSFVKLCECQGRCAIGIDTSLPSYDMIDLYPKSIMGLDGLHVMLDRIMNARRGPRSGVRLLSGERGPAIQGGIARKRMEGAGTPGV